VSTLVFLALLAVGVLASAERLVTAAQARVLASRAGERLACAGQPRACRPAPGPAFRAAYGREGLTVSGYRLPATPARDAREIGFTVAPGQTLCVTGASGSGKSTLLDAITAALRPAPGVVTPVLADDYLFTGTVSTNIRLADPTVSDDEVKKLLASVLLDRSAVEPDTQIGAGGRDLSGGEQRRLHIARALATQPGLLLIDEPVTGLDAATSSHVLAAIRRRLPQAVLVLAMHQLPPDPKVLGSAWTALALEAV
jgi:ATP-binding cassette subfamily C protein CydC